MILQHNRESRRDRLDADRLHTYDLPQIAGALREEPEYDRNGRNSTVLVKQPSLRVLLVALRAGGELPEHHAPGPITVQVLRGEIRFKGDQRLVTLAQGQMLTLPAREAHAVEAVQESEILVTIGPERDPE